MASAGWLKWPRKQFKAEGAAWKLGAERESTQTGIRTQDQLVKSQLLYQLSYLRVGSPGQGRDE